MGKAIAERNEAHVRELAKRQADAGAAFIDVCASVGEDRELETLRWLFGLVESATDTPISIDSPSADIIAAAIPLCRKPGLVNSVSMEGDKADKIFPLIADSKWECVCLLSDDTGIPKSAADRLRVFSNLMKKAAEYGIPPARLHIDPLIEMLCTSEDGIRD
jgi:5-methyltetrahydrofolate--homocysteine methyltransferase